MMWELHICLVCPEASKLFVPVFYSLTGNNEGSACEGYYDVYLNLKSNCNSQEVSSRGSFFSIIIGITDMISIFSINYRYVIFAIASSPLLLQVKFHYNFRCL